MSARRNIASELRLALLSILSPDGECGECGDVFFHLNMEIDHVDGRIWSARDLFQIDRVKRYWREYLDGVRLRALCRSCNAIDGNRRRWSRERSAA